MSSLFPYSLIQPFPSAEDRGLAPHVKEAGGDDVWSEARENRSSNAAPEGFGALHVTVNMSGGNYTTAHAALQ